jgi:hypothetical protein
MTEYNDWINAKYPYDRATCGSCLAQHAEGLCDKPEHAHMATVTKEILGLWIFAIQVKPDEVREKFTNLRELFRDFYPQQANEEKHERPLPIAHTSTSKMIGRDK